MWNELPGQDPPPRPARQGRVAVRWGILAALLLALAAIVLVALWEPLVGLLAEAPALRAWVESLGPWGPVAIVGLGVLQIIVAPLPGYPIVIVSGILFGGWWGAIYANLGMVIGGMLAALLARTFGRPLAERFVARAQLKRVEPLLQSDSPWLWFIVLLLPTGDFPYFAAGLSRIPLRHFLLALIAARVPFTFVITHAAAEAVTLPPQRLLLLALPLIVLGVIAYWKQDEISERVTRWLERLGAGGREPG
jgi:uncharacterized membrane protein YdjX (TVP38/TMEM64 family)